MKTFAHSLAFLVAIDDYQNGVPKLRTPVSDTQELAEVLSQDHGFETEVIANDKATLAGLRTLLANLAERVGNDDRVIFYFAGHGVALDSDDGPKGFILPQDARKEAQAEESLLSMVELDASLSKLKCRHMLVILDCCFAGAFRWASFRHLALATENLHKERYEWFIHDAARQAIASAAQDQKALDVASERPLGKREDDREHSPFAAALMEGLRGAADRAAVGGSGDGVITATELYLYLEDELLPKGAGGFRQTPIFWPLKNHDKGQFVFLVPGKEPNLPPAPPLDADANPWRGLEPYETRHAGLFFGREEVSKKLAERVQRELFIVVTGPSGIGKSSLVRAGLLPRLKDGPLKPIVVRPSPTPFASLSRILKDAGPAGRDADEQALKADPLALASWVKWRGGQGEVLLVVDQVEELITMSRDGAVAKSYLTLIARALDESEGRLRVVFTVRSEFEPQFAQSALNLRWKDARYLVPRMTQDELRGVIERPANVKVLRFESESLIERLVNDVVEMPGALPLLSFALSEMYLNYLRRRSDDRALSVEDYESLKGGVTGALRVRANEIVDDLSETVARRVLERLVSVEAGAFARRRVPRRELKAGNAGEQADIDAVIHRFVEARLLVTDEFDNEPYLELAHDALIFGWDRLVEWIRNDSTRIAQLRLLTADAEEWSASPQQRLGLLWSDAARLTKVKELDKETFPGLIGVERRFATASSDQARLNATFRTVVTTTLASLFGVAVVVAGLWLLGVAGNHIDRLLSTARMLQASGNTQGMYAFALEAYGKARALPALWEDRIASSTLLLEQGVNDGVPMLYDNFNAVVDLDISSDGSQVAVIGRTASDSDTLTLMIGSPDHVDEIVQHGRYQALAFRPGKREIALAEKSDGKMRINLVDASRGTVIRSFVLDTTKGKGDFGNEMTLAPWEVTEMSMTPDGSTLIIAGWAAVDEYGILAFPWRAYVTLQDGSVVQRVAADVGRVDMPPGVQQAVAMSDDGRRVASADSSELYVDDLIDGERKHVGRHNESAETVAISPSGKEILAAGGSKSITLVRDSGHGPWIFYEIILPGPDAAQIVKFVSEDVIAVTRSDQSIAVIRMGSGSNTVGGKFVGDIGIHDASNDPKPSSINFDIQMLRGHAQTIRTILVDRAHNRLISAGDDTTIRIWGFQTGERRVLRGNIRRVDKMRLSHDGEWLLSKSIDGRIMAWSIASHVYLSKVAVKDVFEEQEPGDQYDGVGDGGGLRAYVNRMGFRFLQQVEASPDGKLFAAGYYDGPIAIWSADGGNLRELDTKNGSFAFAKDSEHLISDGQLWDLKTNSVTGYARMGSAITASGEQVVVDQEKLSLRPLLENHKAANEALKGYLSSDDREYIMLNDKRYCVWRRPFTAGGNCGQIQRSFAGGQAIYQLDGQRLLTLVNSGNDGLHLIDFDPINARARVYRTGELGPTFAMSRDGSMIAAAGRFGELYFGATDSDVLREVGRQARQIQSIAFSPDGKWLAAGSLDRTVRIWSTKTQEYAQFEFLNPVASVAFIGSNRLLVASGVAVRSIVVPDHDPQQWQATAEAASNVRINPNGSVASTSAPVSISSFQ